MNEETLYRTVKDAKSPIALFINWSIHKETVTTMKNSDSCMVIERVKTIL